MTIESKIFITGHNGMVGSALERQILKMGHTNIIKIKSNDLDLRNQELVNSFFQKNNQITSFMQLGKLVV